MKNIFKHSLAWRLSLYLIPVICIVFCIIIAWYYNVSRDKIIASSMEKANTVMANMSQKIGEKVQAVSQSIDNTAWLIEKNINDEAKIKDILLHNIQNNPLMIGSAVAYDPGDGGKMKMLYASENDKGISVVNQNTEHYYYPGMDWYIIPKQLKQSYWSEPYFDEGAGNIIMTTYSVPLINEKGEVYAIYTADISLLNFTDVVAKMKPFPDSYSFMLSRNGYYLTHRKKERILHETIYSNAYNYHSKEYVEIGHAMQAGKIGYLKFDNDGDVSYAIYTPISNIGWSICSVCKRDVILSALNSITNSVLVLFVIGIICFMVFCILVIKRTMKPLEGFTASAEEIAHGNFDANLPQIKSQDEMMELHDSFSYMQHSLTSYIAELKQTTASKERIQSELNIAHQIQMGMVPKIFPPFPERDDVDLYAMLKSAKEVAGDLYDFFILGDKLYFIIGDVSGKGVPASLFMAVTRSLFRNIARTSKTPAEIINGINDSISEQNESNMFVTLFLGILDLPTGKLSYCNGGHNPPILISPDGKATMMDIKKNVFVGFMPGFKYEGEEIQLESGAKLFCYTDGVVEAENAEKELYSEARLLKTLEVHSKYGVKRLTEQVLESVSEHVLMAEQSDDITILIVNYKK